MAGSRHDSAKLCKKAEQISKNGGNKLFPPFGLILGDILNGGICMNKAIVAGSFDPFTNGHLELVKKAAKMFDEVIIVIGINSNKTRHFDKNKMVDGINKVLINNKLNNCAAMYFDGPIAVFCEKNNISYTVRGLRNNMDFNYENEIQKTNELINPLLETVYLPADSEAISSSLVREFLSYDLPVKDYVPAEIMDIFSIER